MRSSSPPPGPTPTATVRALAYTDLTPAPAVGDRVLLNVAALDRGLGTGGYALVVAVLDPAGRVSAQPPQPAGHLVKARYLPLQAMVAGADEQGSPHHELLARRRLPGRAAGGGGRPALGPRPDRRWPSPHDRPGTRVVYVMTDQGALPLAFSRSYAELREAGLLAGSVTVGQAFGGDLEAVTVHSGLLAARLALAADLVVLTQGPGNLGTGTRWGFSGVAAGEAVNAAAVLGGRPVGSLRVSAADPRERHRGVSHHSLTAYGRVALMRCAIAVPDFGAEPGLEGLVEPVARAAALLERRHDLVPVDLDRPAQPAGRLTDPAVQHGPRGPGRPGLLPGRRRGRAARRDVSLTLRVRGYCGAWVNSRSTTITRVSWGATDGVGLPSG